MWWISTLNLVLATQAPASGGPPLFPIPAPPFGPATADLLASGDLDGDGVPELLADGLKRLCVARPDGLGGILVSSTLSLPFLNPPTDLSLGDLDGDGDLDVAVAIGMPELWVSMNAGNGAWTAFQALPALTENVLPDHLELADLDTDGDLDVVSAGRAVDVRFGDGTGAFPVGQEYALRDSATAFRLGDFDGDGRSDLALIHEDSDLLTLMRGAHGGGFVPLKPLTGFGHPRTLAVTHLDHDAFADLLISRTWDESVLCYRGNGQFQFQVTGHLANITGSQAIVGADVNADGATDVIAADAGPGGKVHVALGNGQGGVGASFTRDEAFRPMSLAIGDFDGDARSDAVVGGGFHGGLSVLSGIGQAPQPAAKHGFSVAGTERAMYSADLDLDGDRDFVMVLDGPGYNDYAEVHLGDGQGGATLQSSVPLFLVNAPVADLSDFDGDGLPDLVISALQEIFVYRGTGSGFVTPPLLTVKTNGHVSLKVTNVGGDARPDLVAVGLNAVFRLINSGQTGTLSATGLSLGTNFNWSTATIGDVDGDGRAEVLIAKDGTVKILGVSGSIVTTLATLVTPIRYDLRLHDLDGDGHPDLLGLGDTQPYTVIHRGVGGLSFEVATRVYTESSNPAVLADFDGDGGVDIARIEPPSMVEIVRTTADGFIRSVDRYRACSEPMVTNTQPRLLSGDFDGDGAIDLAVSRQATVTSVEVEVIHNVNPTGGAYSTVIGAGCTGSQGITPTLALDIGPADGASKYVFAVHGALAGSQGVLVLAPLPTAFPSPAVCGSYLGVPWFANVPFSTQAAVGNVTSTLLTFELHATTPVAAFATQAFLVDPAATNGLSATNALAVPAH